MGLKSDAIYTLALRGILGLLRQWPFPIREHTTGDAVIEDLCDTWGDHVCHGLEQEGRDNINTSDLVSA